MQKLVYFLALILMLAMAAMGFYIWQNERDKQEIEERLADKSVAPVEVPSSVSSPSPTPATSSAIQLLENSGTITGSVSFPSETIPPMEICAEHIITHLSNVYCTTELLRSGDSTEVTYKLLVPPGIYHVYAKLQNDPYKAYYSEFVTCGLHALCPSHEPIDVEVKGGQEITDVDPHDWYNE